MGGVSSQCSNHVPADSIKSTGSGWLAGVGKQAHSTSTALGKRLGV